MPKLRVIKEWDSSANEKKKVYPITIVKGIYDTENSQPLSTTLSEKVDGTTLATILNSMSVDDATGELIIEYTL